jgi:hypothetical protein
VHHAFFAPSVAAKSCILQLSRLILSNVSAHIQEKRPATLTTYRLSTRLGVYVAKLQTVCNCAYLVELHKKVSCLSLKKEKKKKNATSVVSNAHVTQDLGQFFLVKNM